MSQTTTSNNRKVSAKRKEMLAEVATLKAAIADPNAYMAEGNIFASLERLQTLRTEYSTIAEQAHNEWLARNA